MERLDLVKLRLSLKKIKEEIEFVNKILEKLDFRTSQTDEIKRILGLYINNKQKNGFKKPWQHSKFSNFIK